MKTDIYDADVFDLESFHILEHDENNLPFRWVEGVFKIIPKREVKNICLKFVCACNDKKIVVFIENESKCIKYSFLY